MTYKHIPQKFEFIATQGDKESHITFTTPIPTTVYEDVNINNTIRHWEKIFGVEDYKTILRDLTMELSLKGDQRLVRRDSTDTVRIKMIKTPIIE